MLLNELLSNAERISTRIIILKHMINIHIVIQALILQLYSTGSD